VGLVSTRYIKGGEFSEYLGKSYILRKEAATQRELVSE
jgi:hypothetical protein